MSATLKADLSTHNNTGRDTNAGGTTGYVNMIIDAGTGQITSAPSTLLPSRAVVTELSSLSFSVVESTNSVSSATEPGPITLVGASGLGTIVQGSGTTLLNSGGYHTGVD